MQQWITHGPILVLVRLTKCGGVYESNQPASSNPHCRRQCDATTIDWARKRRPMSPNHLAMCGSRARDEVSIRLAKRRDNYLIHCPETILVKILGGARCALSGFLSAAP